MRLIPLNNLKSSLAFLGFLLLFVSITACKPVFRNEQTGERYYIFEFENRTYHLPYGYVWAYDYAGGGMIEEPNLHALYPGLVARTEENKKEFAALNWANGRLITFVFTRAKDSRDIQAIIERLMSESAPIDKPEVREGFYVYPVRNVKKELYLTDSKGKDGSYFYCGKDQSVPSPSCNTRFILNSDIYIRLTFPKSLLKESKNIKFELKSLLNSFEVNAEKAN